MSTESISGRPTKVIPLSQGQRERISTLQAEAADFMEKYKRTMADLNTMLTAIVGEVNDYQFDEDRLHLLVRPKGRW